MIVVALAIFWFWHSTWLYFYVYEPTFFRSNSLLINSFYQTMFISIVPNLIYRYKLTTEIERQCLSICYFLSFVKFTGFILAFKGHDFHISLYVFSVFASLIYIIVTHWEKIPLLGKENWEK